MNKLKLILESINSRNLDNALTLCNNYEIEEKGNKHLVSNFRGVIYFLKEDLNTAESNFLKSHMYRSDFEDPIKNLYLIYLKKNNLKKLIEFAEKLYELDKTNDLYTYQLAYAYELNNKNQLALDFYKKCIEINSKSKIKALNNAGGIYLKNNKPKISLKYFLEAFNLNNNDKIIINNLLLNYINLKDIKKSDEFFSIAENKDNTYIEFLFNKAEYLILKEKYNEAIEILISNKNILKFQLALIGLYFNMGKENEAKKLLNSSREKFKSNINFYNYIGIRSLYEGNFEDGWKFYEYRGSKLTNTFNMIKEWNGENLKNKSIIVFSEQGLGDSIQFSKYIFSLIKISKKVSFVVSKGIYNLFNNEIDNFNVETNETIKNKDYDYKISLGSLIKFFYREKYNLKDVLIKKNNLEINRWNNKLDKSKANIGLVWSGSFHGPNQPFRSIPLKSLEKVLSLDLNFYSLQNEIWERDKEYFDKSNIFDFGKYNLEEIASIIENLDLVISADTSILHLSCSLNKETWGLFNIYPDWRWGEFNKINPYSSLQMIKQKKFNYWQDVADEIFQKLQKKFNLV